MKRFGDQVTDTKSRPEMKHAVVAAPNLSTYCWRPQQCNPLKVPVKTLDMASILSNDGKDLLEEYPFVSRKRFKISELPLSSAQRSTIEGLLHTIKKKGEYDALRKQVWSQYVESVSAEGIIVCELSQMIRSTDGIILG